MHGEAMPCVKPADLRKLEYSCCHPSAAARVPYMCFFSNPHLPSAWPGCSGGRATYVSSAPSVDALKYALEMSMADTCVLSVVDGATFVRLASTYNSQAYNIAG